MWRGHLYWKSSVCLLISELNTPETLHWRSHGERGKSVPLVRDSIVTCVVIQYSRDKCVNSTDMTFTLYPITAAYSSGLLTTRRVAQTVSSCFKDFHLLPSQSKNTTRTKIVKILSLDVLLMYEETRMLQGRNRNHHQPVCRFVWFHSGIAYEYE